MKPHIWRRFAPVAVLGVAAALGLGAIAIAQDWTSAPTRELFSRGDARFLRHWQVLGPFPGGLDAAIVGAEGALAPAAEPARALGLERRWTSFDSWGDTIDVSGNLGTPAHRGSRAAEESAYAHTTVTRAADGEAVLSFAADGPARIWVNGQEVHRRDAQPFSFDAERIGVRLKRGENSILLKLAHRTGAWRFALRVLEPGAVINRIDEIVPHFVSAAGPGEIAFRTDVEGRSQGASVNVAIVGAGGRVAAERSAARGELVRFATGAWPDGAYDIVFSTRDQRGAYRVSRLAWYKGDAIAAARRLAETARTPPEKIDAGHLQMLTALVQDRLGADPNAIPDDAWALIHSPLMEFEELLLDAGGQTGAIRPYGFVRLAWRDETDGSTQFCRAYLPANYNPDDRRPTIVYLHGYNPPNPPYIRFWRVDGRHDAFADRMGVIWIEAHGRANAQYIGIGEADVLNCLAEAKRRLAIDEDRVYLMGESMGGSGTWHVASRHPELFAAIAPIFGGWDYRVVPGPFNYNNPSATSLPERYAQEAQSSFAGAENLLNVPVYVQHGDADRAVNVGHSRHAVRMLERWGYDIRYKEHPGGAHEDLKVFEENVEWMLAHRRNPAPRRVRIRAMDLGGAQAHWVSVRAFEAPMTPIEVDAEVVTPGRVRLDTRNAAIVALRAPRAASRRGRGNAQVTVVWNGTERSISIPQSGEAILALPGADQNPRRLKRPGLEGGLSRFMTTPFAVIVGTSSRDPEMRRLIAEKADVFADLWERWQHVRPRVVLDRDLSRADERAYSLMLLGGPDANLVARRLAGAVPMRLRSDAVVIGARSFAARDAVAQMVYPSPANPDRYVLLVASTSTAGMHFWNPAAYHHPVFGFPLLSFDWTIEDGRRVALPNGLGAYRGWVAAGVFDAHWRSDDRYVFTGDAQMRANARLAVPPASSFRLGRAKLDAYAGRYRLPNGFVVQIARDGDSLVALVPGAAPEPLVPWSETDFVLRSNVAPVTFSRDAAGGVTGFEAINDGQSFSATRMN
jgi:predicted esterase